MRIQPPTAWVISDSGSVAEKIASPLTDAGFSVLRRHPAECIDRILAGDSAELLVLDWNTREAERISEIVEKHAPFPYAVLLAEADRMPRLKKDYRKTFTDFLTTPVDMLDAEIAFCRAAELVRAVRWDRPVASLGLSAETTESDIPFFAQQMMTHMGAFIDRLSRDVQGGVRYFDEVPYFVAIHDVSGTIISANDNYMKYFGDWIGRPGWEIYAEEMAGKETCPVGKAVASGGFVSIKTDVRYQSGTVVPVIVHASPVLNTAGDVSLVLEVFAGIRDVERLADDVHNTQQRYRQLFDAVPNYIAVLDRQLRITAFNRRFMEDFGFKTGRNFYHLFRPVGAAPDDDPIGRTLRTGQNQQGEMLLLSPTSEPLNLLAWTSPIFTAAGKLVQVLVIFTDVTELRRLQDNLSQLGLMISTISHSLKGSLTGLDAGLYLIDNGFYREKPGRIEEGLDVARLMTERVRKLVRDILYYSKERELHTERMDATQFALDLAAGVRHRIVGANIEFRQSIRENVGMVDIDSSLLRSALVNVLDNAVEACIEETEKKSHYIEFSLRGRLTWVEIIIEDNGPGMDDDQRQNVFKLFWSTKGAKGTGLGLFITKKVIEKHGGTVRTTSRPGEGSTFYIRLPKSPSGRSVRPTLDETETPRL